jgi:hypothetical protein
MGCGIIMNDVQEMVIKIWHGFVGGNILAFSRMGQLK